ncbi:Flavin-dependent oxidoreductase, luciferase family (includes alkanesulfonate monooxygenase SsuD and methylene tetrahydromethanopterin reductase) [Shimia gijangensis]|uniref:Flavin-dependent oxidoreductase, luciferase family (Includes alkanesulfonate monooxygenase SsuD and methylene tetrahydromethanopterin reductase) n=1 Tax=Shimia gijangensis TaxID=1470563 RepID=A0A1M6S6Z6_9RHOB|nr:LLM class flavin-dependent oxidoreductase [Shimia gijangensis]SHK40471.1 Flavin-dependent oxidoreductase, luciferase family (includes alkanesulfonate monooxygenase SsuD and methylene tetrahydromethanopterin reductase) [Shimia gijangensis]
MKFCIQLSPYYPDKTYGGDRVFADMLEQAKLADSLGFDSVSITEHHLLNILMMPAPLQFATQIAAHTEHLKIITSIAVLPLHDMRIYAGEVVCADIFTNGRLMLGVGRGAFAYEMARCGVPMDETLEKFNESLDLLQKLLSQEEVSADGKYYKFDPVTVMPRPLTPNGPQMMMAVLNPEGIYHCTKRGFHIQTTPLAGQHQLLLDQVSAFNRAKDEMGDTGKELTLSLSRVGFVANSAADHARILEQAERYYARFDNVFTGPGIVENGLIKELPRKQTRTELDDILLIGSPQEIVDKLGAYSDLGLDRLIFSCNFGMSQTETLENLQQFAEEVAPHFSDAPVTA